MYPDFGSIPHKVNMAAKTIVSPGTRRERSSVGEGGGGDAERAQFVAAAITLSNGNNLVLCTRLFYSLPCRSPPETIH